MYTYTFQKSACDCCDYYSGPTLSEAAQHHPHMPDIIRSSPTSSEAARHHLKQPDIIRTCPTSFVIALSCILLNWPSFAHFKLQDSAQRCPVSKLRPYWNPAAVRQNRPSKNTLPMAHRSNIVHAYTTASGVTQRRLPSTDLEEERESGALVSVGFEPTQTGMSSGS